MIPDYNLLTVEDKLTSIPSIDDFSTNYPSINFILPKSCPSVIKVSGSLTVSF